MNSEAKLKDQCFKLVKQLQAKGEPIWAVKIHGGPHQQAGLPDVHVTYRGRSLWIELKAPGKSPTPLQLSTLNKIQKAGAIAGWVTTVQEFEDLLFTDPLTRRV